MQKSSPRVGILLVNLGTPDSTGTPDIRRYLKEFLSDPRVIDIPAAARWLLLNLIILPFRPRKAAAAYKKIWQPAGSPLKVYTEQLCQKFQAALDPGQYSVKYAMRYQNPSLEKILSEFAAMNLIKIKVVLLFPQYSSAAWGSAAQKIMEVQSKSWNIPALEFVPFFYDHPDFINLIAQKTQPFLQNKPYDKILFSYHGLPERHCQKSTPALTCNFSEACCSKITNSNRYCYRAQCFATTRLIVEQLKLADGSYITCFQSRLGRTPWIKPYTDTIIEDLAKAGAKHLLVVSPSFTADCLETVEEISVRGHEQFQQLGGETLDLVPSLNADSAWVEALTRICGLNPENGRSLAHG